MNLTNSEYGRRNLSKQLHSAIFELTYSIVRTGRRAIAPLMSIVNGQRGQVLMSNSPAMDETPIKVGPKNKSKGTKTKCKMHHGCYWPLHGEDDKVAFTYLESRARLVIEKIVRDTFSGTLVSDGYAACPDMPGPTYR